MCRSFTDSLVDPAIVEEIIELATRAPSAGKSQGWHFVVLTGHDIETFWSITLPSEKRMEFAWPGLLRAPVLILPFADSQAYLDRYSEADKASTGLGRGVEFWPAPYWTIDTSFAVMTLLLAATDRGLGSLFFGVFNGEAELRHELDVPPHVNLLGAIALGWPSATERSGRSSKRPRLSDEVVHRGRW